MARRRAIRVFADFKDLGCSKKPVANHDAQMRQPHGFVLDHLTVAVRQVTMVLAGYVLAVW
jgi:hypothetical protein